MSKAFSTEADLVAAYCALIERRNANPRVDQKWTLYHETAGWDLLMVDPASGLQVGIEAKLSLNAKVLNQSLPTSRWYEAGGPDYRAVLVPRDGLQHHIGDIAAHLGIRVLALYNCRPYAPEPDWSVTEPTPDETTSYLMAEWHSWHPAERCKLPDYVPDVMGGKASPVTLTPWKVKAIKLLVILDKRGHVTRADMKELGISPTLWTQAKHGLLASGQRGYVRCDRTPDLRGQHPRNYSEIETDIAKWAMNIVELGA